MKRPVLFALCFFALGTVLRHAAGQVPAPGLADNLPVSVLEGHAQTCFKTLAQWQSFSRWGLAAAIIVGIFGVLIGALQTLKSPTARATTFLLGMSVSIITLVTSAVLVTDYRVYRSAANQAGPVYEDMAACLQAYKDPGVSDATKMGVYNAFFADHESFKKIAHDHLDQEISETASMKKPPTAIGGAKEPTLGFLLELLPTLAPETVYAQSAAAPPDWTTTNGRATSSGIYYVGSSTRPDPKQAQDQASANATFNAIVAQMPGGRFDPRQQMMFNLLAASIRKAQTITDNVTIFDPRTHQFIAYTRILLPPTNSRLQKSR